MNNPHAHIEPEPSDRKVLISALGWLGVIFVFAVVVAIAYLPNRATSQEQRDNATRLQIRAQNNAEQARLVGAYEWVDQQRGIVRIPVERAMRLTVDELRAQQQQAAGTGN